MNFSKRFFQPDSLLDMVLELREQVYQEGVTTFCRWQPLIRRSTFNYSALNLAFYLALRRRDLRDLQRGLAAFGLSSLGRSEAKAIVNLDAVIASLAAIAGQEVAVSRPTWRSLFTGEHLLQRNTNMVLGPQPDERVVRIMVTLPREAAEDPAFMSDLLRHGTDCVRINCSHDDREIWEAMVRNVRQAETVVGRSCRILVDLAGPKPRIERLLLSSANDRVAEGDHVLLARGEIGHRVNVPVAASVNLPEVFEHLREGDPVLVDDGRIEARVISLDATGALLRISRVSKKDVRLRPEKSLNFPRTLLTLSPLTSKDLADLDFAVQHADMIGYSFVRTATDIDLLQQELAARAVGKMPALIAKIETLDAVENLAEIIVRAAGRQPFGLMIARGDLAVEAGYQRIAELQEEILWVAEAAHVPVIWATQVLENLIKSGVPSRAEVTDAAMSIRAECVMLNKGQYIGDAVSFLNDVLGRMQSHQHKKTAQLRALKIARPGL